MSLNFNTENWPIVYLKIDKTLINNEIYEEYQRTYLKLLIKCKNNKEKMILICNLSNANNLPLNLVMKQVQFNKDIYKYNKEYLKCACILCNNKYLKSVLNTYFSISKPAAPYKICSSYDKINKYLKEKFNIKIDSSIFNDEDLENSELNDIENDTQIDNLEDVKKYITNIDTDENTYENTDKTEDLSDLINQIN
jgi:hypothetical protein